MIKTWRICFFRCPEQRIDVRAYEGISTGRRNETSMFDWFIVLSLLPFGLIPGALWWFFTIHRDSFHVSLTRHHGHAELTLYHGLSERRMHDIARAVRQAAGLRHDEA